MNHIFETALQATTTYTDVFTGHFTIANSDADDYLVDAFTAALTIASSIADGGQGATDAFSASVTHAATFANIFTGTGSGSRTIIRDRHHNTTQSA